MVNCSKFLERVGAPAQILKAIFPQSAKLKNTCNSQKSTHLYLLIAGWRFVSGTHTFSSFHSAIQSRKMLHNPHFVSLTKTFF